MIAVSSKEHAEFLRYKKGNEWEVRMVAENTRTNDGPRATLTVGEEKIKFLVDIGTPRNVIDHPTFENLSHAVKLEQCSTQFYGYRSYQSLPILA